MSIDATSPRYARQRTLSGFGVAGQEALAAARVLVIGAGGLGCAVLPTLAAAGIGHLAIVDGDTVDESNLHRQTLYSLADVGRPKAEAAAEVLRTLSPDADIVAHAAGFDAGTAATLAADVTLLIDATDNPAARYLANDLAASLAIPLVWGSALGWVGQVGVAWDARGADYRDLFPTEPAVEGATCATVGVLPSVCTTIGGMMAGEALKIVSASGDPLVGRVLQFDARTGRVRELAFRRSALRARGQASVSPGSPAAAPSAGSRPRALEPAELKRMLDAREPLVLIDVREPWEAERVQIPGSLLVPFGNLAARVAELDPAAPTIVYCHHGPRAFSAAEFLARRGFGSVAVLNGGIDAWAREADPMAARY